MPKRATTIAVFFSLCLLLLQGCYTFNGSSLPARFKTIAVPVFNDRSGAGIANYRAELTRGLIDKIESQSALRFTPSPGGADLLLEGAIVSFSDQTGQLSSVTQRALTNRITLVVEVSVQDRLKGKMLFTQSFVGFADYPVGNYIAQQEAIRFALSQITEEIFDRVVSGW